MISFGRGALALFVCAAGQFLLARYLPAIGASVDLFTILVVYYGVTRRKTGVMVVGTAAGLAQDLLSHGFLGMNAFKKTLIGYLMGMLGGFFLLSQPLPRFGVLFIATLVEAITEAGLALVLGQRTEFPAPGALLRLGIGNGLVGTLFCALLARAE